MTALARRVVNAAHPGQPHLGNLQQMGELRDLRISNLATDGVMVRPAFASDRPAAHLGSHQFHLDRVRRTAAAGQGDKARAPLHEALRDFTVQGGVTGNRTLGRELGYSLYLDGGSRSVGPGQLSSGPRGRPTLAN